MLLLILFIELHGEIKKRIYKKSTTFVLLFSFFFCFYILFNIDIFNVFKKNNKLIIFNNENNFYSASEETQISKEAQKLYFKKTKI